MLALLSLLSPALAAEIVVPTDQSSIASAVAAAVSGDEITVLAGTWVEAPITISGKDLTIRGQGVTPTTWRGSPALSAPVLTIVNSDVVIEDLIVDGAGSARAISATDTDLTLTRATLTGGRAEVSVSSNPGGGCVLVEGGDLRVQRSLFEDCSSNARGGALAVVNSGGEAWQATFRANTASSGGAVYVVDSIFDFLESEFDSNTADRLDGGAVLVAEEEGTASSYFGPAVFTDNTAVEKGGALACRGGRCDGIDLWFQRNHAAIGGAVHLFETSDATFLRGTFCHNTAEGSSVDGAGIGDGGAIFADHSEGTVELSNAVFFENQAFSAGGALASIGSDLSVINPHVLSNDAEEAASAMWVSGGSSTVTSALFYDNRGAPGPALVLDGEDATLTVDYSLLDNNDTPFGTDTVVLDNNITNQDPLMLAFAPGVCRLENLFPRVGSPLVDSGNESDTDHDGTRADIGAFGGDDADPALYLDRDEDGVIALFDCDDFDHMQNEWVTGFRDSDADGFGDPLATSLGCVIPEGYTDDDSDCDDSDAGVSPDGVEDDSQVDRDCDGYTDPATPLQLAVCGCQATTGTTGHAALLLFLAVFARRRRERTSRPR